MATNGGNAHTRATRALDRILNKPVSALLGWQKSDTEIVISAPGGLGRVYITWPESGTRDIAVNRRGVPLAGRLPILVVPGEPNVIVDIDSSDMAAVAAVFNDQYGTLPHPLSSHQDVLLTTLSNDEVLAWDATAGKWVNVTQAGALVTSVNTQTGDVVLDADDIDETASRIWFTPAEETKLAGIEAGANLYVHPNHSGDVTSAGDGATTIANDVVTNAKAANMAQATIKGRAAGAGTGDPTDLNATQVRTILNVADNADNTATAISGATTDDTIADADVFGYLTGGVLVKTAWNNIKALLTTLFNGLYVGLTGNQTVGGQKTFSSKMYASDDIVLVLNKFIRVIDSGGAERSVFGSESADNSVSFFNNFDGDGGPIRIRPLAAGGESARFDENGRFGIGVTSPQAPLHVHDGTGGSLFVTKTGVNGTAQTILDGANDVLRRCVITYVLWATDNTMSGGATITIANNASFQVFVDVGNNNGVTFAVASNGTLTIQRTTGTKTFNFAGHIVWL